MTDHDRSFRASAHKLPRPRHAPKLYSQDGKGYEATVHEHYFLGGSDWLVTEYDPEEDLAFGWACLSGDRQNAELGYTSLAELESVAVPLTLRLSGGQQLPGGALRVERDEHWTPVTLTEAIAYLDRAAGR